MAVAFANLGVSATPDFASGTDAASYATGSWTPPTNDLIILYVFNRATTGAPNTPTVSGNGLTWTQIKTVVDSGNLRRMTLFGANASGSSAGATTIDFAGQTQTMCYAFFFQATSVDLSGGVAAAFVQSPTGTGSATSGSITLAAAGSADNRPISGWFHSAQQGSTERTNWTEADDLSAGAPVGGMETQYRSDAFEITASASWVTSAVWVGIAAEIKAAAPVADDLSTKILFIPEMSNVPGMISVSGG